MRFTPTKTYFAIINVLIGNRLVAFYQLIQSQLKNNLQEERVERDQVYEKLSSFAKQQAKFAGYGLIFSEREDWKRKRRIMGSLFTYDFIKENLSSI